MAPPTLSTPCCAKPLQKMPAAIPCSKEQSNSSPPSERKSANAAAPRIPSSSKKNTPLPSGNSSMPSSASTPSIHDGLERSHSRSPVLGRTSHGGTKTRRKIPAQRAAVALFGLFSGLPPSLPAHVALRAACSRLPSQRPLACVQVCLFSPVAQPGLHICLSLRIFAIARVFAPGSSRPSGCLRQAV